MRDTSANYNTQNALNVKNRVSEVEFAGITRKYASQTFTDIDSDYKKYLLDLVLNLADMDLTDSPIAQLGEFSFTIADKDLDLTTQIKNNDLEGVDITIKDGFQEIAIADFTSLPAQKVKDVQLREDNLSYRFTTRDARRLFSKKLFRRPSKNILDGDHVKGVNNIDLVDSTGFINPTNLPEYHGQNGYVVIGQEIQSYNTIAANQLQTVSNGSKGTDEVAHGDGATVYQFYGWGTAPLPHVLLNVLMTTEDGSGHSYYDLASFDSGFNFMGLGLSSAEVNVPAIEQLGQKYDSPSITEGIQIGSWREENPIDWIEQNILKPLGWFMYVDLDGKLTVNSFDSIHIDEKFSAVDTIDDSDIVSGSFKMRYDKLINYMEHHYHFNPLTKSYAQIDEFKLDNSVTNYGKTEKPFVVKNNLLARGFPPSDAMQGEMILRRWFYIWGNVPGTFQLKTKSNQWLIEPGDYVNITYDNFPELTDGTRGWTTKKAIITSQKISKIFGQDEDSEYTLEGITWELFDRVNKPMYTITAIESGSLTRTTLTYNATNSALLQAEDAYHDFGPAVSAQMFIVTVRLTGPNITPNGSSYQNIKLGFHIQNPAGTDYASVIVRREVANYIKYDINNPDVVDYEFIIFMESLQTVERVKIDFFESKQTDGTNSTAPQQPTLAFRRLQYITLDEAISKL